MEEFRTKSSVKQGRLLSPLFHSLFINDLDDWVEEGVWLGALNVRIMLYVDDL